MLKWILPWNPSGWPLAAAVALVALAGVGPMLYPSGISDDKRWRAYCTSLSGKAVQIARWRGPATLEMCDGRRIELTGAGGTAAERQCSWLARAESLGVALEARSLRFPYWDVRPVKEFASATHNVPLTARLLQTTPTKYGPSDKCALDEMR
jgi:hypothetical protein